MKPETYDAGKILDAANMILDFLRSQGAQPFGVIEEALHLRRKRFLMAVKVLLAEGRIARRGEWRPDRWGDPAYQRLQAVYYLPDQQAGTIATTPGTHPDNAAAPLGFEPVPPAAAPSKPEVP